MTAARRASAVVMRLPRMGRMFPTRLSFLRVLIRNLAAANARVERVLWKIDDQGFGEALYTLRLSEGDVSLFAVTRPLDDAARSDRVIATAWDAVFVLCDGVPDDLEMARLSRNAPLQEAGRFCERDLVLSRANKSVRLFSHVVDALRQGRQPDATAIRDTGYLMRTTAVYGNGKFGLADHAGIAGRPILGGCFMAEMLCVWLIRGFTHDLVEHLGGGTLEPRFKRHLGVGNATGLGMAPYLVSHPELIDKWFGGREAALAAVLSSGRITPDRRLRMVSLAGRVGRHLEEWNVADEEAMAEILALRNEWKPVRAMVETGEVSEPAAILGAAASVGSQELCVAYLLECFPEIADPFGAAMVGADPIALDPSMRLSRLSELIQRDWTWATNIDFGSKKATARFWYVSEEKLEPRIGWRHEEPGAELENPLDVARRVAALARDLEGAGGTVARFLLDHPGHRTAVHRVQILAQAPYAEIRGNLLSDQTRPIDMLRSKLAMFGAAKFDPKSDLWTRITLAQGAPLLHELGEPGADDWWLAEMMP